MNQVNTQDTKVALVTGSARRIGAAIIKYLHGAGFRVVIHCHASQQEAQALCQQLNQARAQSAIVVQQELSEARAAETLLSAVKQWAGRLDVLVNNASLFIRSNEQLFNAGDWQRQFAVNVQAPYILSLAARPLLRQVQGCIINISDIHAERPIKGYAVYCQSKAALEMQTKALAREFAPEIRVNAVAPGAIAWPESANTLSNAEQQQIINKTALKRHGDPSHIAQAVLALVENSFITGQILKVDGGRSIVD